MNENDDARILQTVEDLDARITAQLNEILHHPAFQRLEAAWRGLWHVVEQVDPRDRVELELFHVTQSELLDDLLRGPSASRLHDLVHDEPYVRGGRNAAGRRRSRPETPRRRAAPPRASRGCRRRWARCAARGCCGS